MFTSIFAIIELVLKLFRLWDQFLDYSDARRLAEAEAKRQSREKALEDSIKAGTDDEIWDSQDRIVDNKP